MSDYQRRRIREQENLLFEVRRLTSSIAGITEQLDTNGLKNEAKTKINALKRLVESLVIQLEIAAESDARAEDITSDLVVSTSVFEPSHEKLKILLAEDDEDNIFILKSILKEGSYEIHVAKDGAEAVQKFQEGDFDLVLMDLKMPVMDGSTATKSIRFWEETHGRSPVPILALSASVKEGREKMLRSGANNFISKPFKKFELFEKIDKLFPKRSEEKQAS